MNVNTVRAVYQRLEHEGLIDSQQGSGTFVASLPTHAFRRGHDRRRRRPRGARDRGRPARGRGRPLHGLRVLRRSAPIDEAAERRRLLRAQIAGLERTLGELEAGHPGLAPTTSTATRGGSAPRLLEAAELEQVRTSLVRRLVTLQTAIDALGREGALSDEAAPHRRSARQPERKRAGRSPSNGRPRVETRPAAAGRDGTDGKRLLSRHGCGRPTSARPPRDPSRLPLSLQRRRGTRLAANPLSQREAELQLSELDQMRASLEALRQRRSTLPAQANRLKT